VQALIVGKGEEERKRLEVLGESHGMKDRVRFLGAIYGERELAPYFMSSDVFCYPANIGLSILHAFGYGLPVVTSDHIGGQNPEIEALKPGENGLLYRHGDADSLAETLDQIFSDKEKAREMSVCALATVDELFNIETMVNGIEASIRGRVSV
jgi:glycosyltransferase involved in cell wall biosynthesis